MDKQDKLLITNLTQKYVRSLVIMSEKEQAKGQTPKEHGRDVQLEHESVITLSEPSWSTNFIKGKGEGLIFLLHGKPGVGKTYTAKCVAAHTERPLLSLNCADNGTDPGTIEDKLNRWFKLAKSWGAILLIDEADIYMEHRQVQDLARNNLVAGFLKALEYYQGMLFLTTNRVGTFDKAFISRIHIMLHYPPFTDKDREDVWENFFRKLESEDDKMRIQESTRSYVTSEEVQSLQWNGGEIRNAFQIAVALAQVEDSRDKKGLILIKRDHIRSTVRMSKNFKDYLKDLYKKDETQMAATKGHRLDTFGSKTSE